MLKSPICYRLITPSASERANRKPDRVASAGSTRSAAHVPREPKAGGDMNSERRLISIPEVQAAVAQMFHLSRAQLLSRSRRQNIAHARQIAMYLSRELTGRPGGHADADSAARGPSASFPRIGIAFGRDHSSVIHACNRVARRRTIDADFAKLLDRLSHYVRGARDSGGSAREAL